MLETEIVLLLPYSEALWGRGSISLMYQRSYSHIVVSLDPILLLVCAHNIKDNLQEDWWSDGLLSTP